MSGVDIVLILGHRTHGTRVWCKSRINFDNGHSHWTVHPAGSSPYDYHCGKRGNIQGKYSTDITVNRQYSDLIRDIQAPFIYKSRKYLIIFGEIQPTKRTADTLRIRVQKNFRLLNGHFREYSELEICENARKWNQQI